MNRSNKGITLIALVVTIIVLLILAGITISLLLGKNGILSQAQKAKEQTIIGDEKEAVSLAYAACKTNNLMDVVTDNQLQQELENNKRNVTVTTIMAEELKVVFNETNHAYMVDGDGRVEEYLPLKKNRIYATSYCKKILALAVNPSITIGAERYRKYFDELKVDDSEAFYIIRANAVSNYLYAYAINPSLKGSFNEILETLTYQGKISPKNDTPLVQAEYMKNAGLLILGYSRNPSLASDFINEIDKNNPYVTATYQSENYMVNADLTYNKELEEVKAAREEILGDFNIAYARNPSLRDGFLDKFNKLVAIEKNENPSAKEQAGAVKAVGKTIMAYSRNPSFRDYLFSEILEIESCLIKNPNLEEVQVARAETLEALIAAIYRNPSLLEQLVNFYNQYLGLPPENPSPRVQAISLYNSGNLLEVLGKTNGNETILTNYEKVNIDITANTDEIQAASLANLGRLYWTLPFTDEAGRTTMLEFFRTKLYKEITSTSPIIQAAKYYSEGYYDAAYQEIMRITDTTERDEKLKTLEELKKEFSPNIEIDYTLEEVQIAKIEFLNTIYDSYYTEVGGRYFTQNYREYQSSAKLLYPSEEYFAKK